MAAEGGVQHDTSGPIVPVESLQERSARTEQEWKAALEQALSADIWLPEAKPAARKAAVVDILKGNVPTDKRLAHLLNVGKIGADLEAVVQTVRPVWDNAEATQTEVHADIAAKAAEKTAKKGAEKQARQETENLLKALEEEDKKLTKSALNMLSDLSTFEDDASNFQLSDEELLVPTARQQALREESTKNPERSMAGYLRAQLEKQRAEATLALAPAEKQDELVERVRAASELMQQAKDLFLSQVEVERTRRAEQAYEAEQVEFLGELLKLDTEISQAIGELLSDDSLWGEGLSFKQRLEIIEGIKTRGPAALAKVVEAGLISADQTKEFEQVLGSPARKEQWRIQGELDPKRQKQVLEKATFNAETVLADYLRLKDRVNALSRAKGDQAVLAQLLTQMEEASTLLEQTYGTPIAERQNADFERAKALAEKAQKKLDEAKEDVAGLTKVNATLDEQIAVHEKTLAPESVHSEKEVTEAYEAFLQKKVPLMDDARFWARRGEAERDKLFFQILKIGVARSDLAPELTRSKLLDEFKTAFEPMSVLYDAFLKAADGYLRKREEKKDEHGEPLALEKQRDTVIVDRDVARAQLLTDDAGLWKESTDHAQRERILDAARAGRALGGKDIAALSVTAKLFGTALEPYKLLENEVVRLGIRIKERDAAKTALEPLRVDRAKGEELIKQLQATLPTLERNVAKSALKDRSKLKAALDSKIAHLYE